VREREIRQKNFKRKSPFHIFGEKGKHRERKIGRGKEKLRKKRDSRNEGDGMKVKE